MGGAPTPFTADARKSFAYEIADAEARNPTTLALLVWRAGTTSTMTLTLRTMGAYIKYIKDGNVELGAKIA